MAFSPKPWLSILGTNVQGDLGGWTMYTDRYHRIVIFPQAPPKEPASYLQFLCRQKFRDAAMVWHALSEQQRADWERATHAPRLVLTGWNLFCYWYTSKDDAAIETISRSTGVVLLPIAI